MIAIGIHFNAHLSSLASKTGEGELSHLNGAESGSEPFAGLRDALAGAFGGEFLSRKSSFLKIREKEIGNSFVGGSCRFLENGGWRGISRVSFATLSFCQRTERSAAI